MWLRRGFFGWLVPAAFLLPLWLFIGWGVFDAGGWAFLWVLFVAIPSVFLGQLVLTLLVRARASVRAQRAVSWWDVLGFGVWHSLTIALGFFGRAWWAPVMLLTVVVGIALFWLVLWQLWREAAPGRLRRTAGGMAFVPPPTPRQDRATAHRVIVVAESDPPSR